jgi:succinoglycan biosynthesis transport protein ExoP
VSRGGSADCSVENANLNTPTNASPLSPAEVLRTLIEQRKLLLIPAVACTLLALVAALLMPRSWQASQAMVVRDEAAGAREGDGRFRAIDDMKALQETVLELSKSRSVIEATLKQVGPADGVATAAFPTTRDISDLRDAVSLTPPKGAEFGKTEVFYLQVKDRSPDRAVALSKALSSELQARLQSLRDDKAKSTIAELERSAELADNDLERATTALSGLETQVGGDLAELRLLNGGNNGDSDLRRKTVEIENELRAAKLARQENESFLALLESARGDQAKLLAMPNRLLESQPGLRRLKDGLVDAQLRTAQLRGNMSDEHPLVVASVVAEKNVANQVHAELENAVRAVSVDLELNAARIATLQTQVNQNHQRLQNLAGLRANYSNLTAEVEQRSQLLQKARRELSEAEANQAGAKGPGVITLIDAPDLGDRPVGPSRAMIVAGGLAGGLAIGLGLVFLLAPTPGTAANSTTSPRMRTEGTGTFGGLRGALESLTGRHWAASR